MEKGKNAKKSRNAKKGRKSTFNFKKTATKIFQIIKIYIKKVKNNISKKQAKKGRNAKKSQGSVNIETK